MSPAPMQSDLERLLLHITEPHVSQNIWASTPMPIAGKEINPVRWALFTEM